jgi:hypothetical protein
MLLTSGDRDSYSLDSKLFRANQDKSKTEAREKKREEKFTLNNLKLPKKEMKNGYKIFFYCESREIAITTKG